MPQTFNQLIREIDAHGEPLNTLVEQAWRQINLLPRSASERTAFRSHIAGLHEELGRLLSRMQD